MWGSWDKRLNSSRSCEKVQDSPSFLVPYQTSWGRCVLGEGAVLPPESQ